MKRFFKSVSVVAIAAALALPPLPAKAQVTTPGLPLVPLGYCQLTAAQLASAVGLSSCVRAHIASASGSGTTLTVASMTDGTIKVGDALGGNACVPAGTTITAFGTGTGGAGTYTTSAATTCSSNALTSGGIPPLATMAFLQAETASVRYRDDGAAPTGAIGNLIVNTLPGILYSGQGGLAALQFILNTGGSPLLDVAFYK